MTLFTRCFCNGWTRLTLFGAFFATNLRTWLTLTTSTVFLLTRSGGGFALFSLLACALRLNASFCFFELLTSVSNMLLFQFATRVAVKVNANCAWLNAVQIAPDLSIKT